MSAILILMVIAAALFAGWYSSARKTYFDPKLYSGTYPCTLDRASENTRGPLDPEIESWFATPLRAANEPSLYLDHPAAGTTTLRFTFLPSFSPPMIVRIEDLYGERPRLTATRVRNLVVLKTGADHFTRDLTKAEAKPLVDFLASTRVLDLPPDHCLAGVDGFIFLIEATGPEGYRFINRWGPRSGPVYDLGNIMFRLTGWPNGPQGPDRSEFGSGYFPDGQQWPRPT